MAPSDTSTAPVTSTDLFPTLVSMTPAELALRRKTIIGDRTSHRALSDEELEELSAIVSLLRRKQSGPPREKEEKPAKGSKPKGLDLGSLALD